MVFNHSDSGNVLLKFGKDTLEHKQPLSHNGTNLYENLAIACQKCNSSKGKKTEEEYRRILKPCG